MPREFDFPRGGKLNMWWHRKSTATADEPIHQYWEMLGVRNQWAEGLDKAEELILHDLYNESKNEPILEVGIGGGRITSHLLNITTQYVGIDFSARIVEASKSKFPDADLRECDARSMACFDSNSFHVVMLWDQVIDDVRPAERSVILREANRILKQNGILLLSSHNLDWNGLAEVNRPSWNELDFRRITVYGRTLLNQFWTQVTQKDCAVFPEYYPPQLSLTHL
ncbi:MAG: class I SAM-dependent methyltransferase, partial [Blastocatellia bacterium]|nr:class I SAM-dependent methyltransferase [Blastocatellia bacterium]